MKGCRWDIVDLHNLSETGVEISIDVTITMNTDCSDPPPQNVYKKRSGGAPNHEPSVPRKHQQAHARNTTHTNQQTTEQEDNKKTTYETCSRAPEQRPHRKRQCVLLLSLPFLLFASFPGSHSFSYCPSPSHVSLVVTFETFPPPSNLNAPFSMFTCVCRSQPELENSAFSFSSDVAPSSTSIDVREIHAYHVMRITVLSQVSRDKQLAGCRS